MQEKATVHIEDQRDRRRFTCPRGHRGWEPTNHHFRCHQCSRNDDVEATFTELRDRKTGTRWPLERVNLHIAGP